jgi:hypothetical protein
MKNLLKTSLGCLFITLLLNAAFTFAQGLIDPHPMLPIPPDIQWEPPWLQINCHNPAKNQKLKPEWTVIVSAMKPAIRQIDIHRWEITFKRP